jgi:predicted small lipoprotein YifL
MPIEEGLASARLRRYGAATFEDSMALPFNPPGRLLLTAVLLALSLAACGRRGPLEAPPEAAAVSAQPRAQARAASDDDGEEVADATLPSPVPTPRRRSRAYTIPKEPFVLDPLL